LHQVAIDSSPSTIEQLQYDVTWNPVWFDLRLFQLWLAGANAPPDKSDFWPPEPHIWAGLEEHKSTAQPINIRQYAVPQTGLIRTWQIWQATGARVCWWICAASLVFGLTGFAYISRLVFVSDAALKSAELSVDAL